MLKKLPISLLLLMVFNIPLAAQHSHVEFTYQSLRPFIHFQLNFNSYGYDYNAYERTYLKGYMDGVNDEHHYGYNFADMLLNFEAYRKGYHDGFRDRQLLIRLRGHHWYKRHRFAYNDYYTPVFAVRIWLEGLSLSFLQAPAHRLPDRWEYRAHPDFKKYRRWMSQRDNRNHDQYYSSRNIERRFKKRIHNYRQKMHAVKKEPRRNISHDRDRDERKHRRGNRGFKPFGDIEIDLDHNPERRNRSVRKDHSHNRESVKKGNHRKRTRGTVRERARDDKKSRRKSRGGGSRGRDG